MGSAVGPGTVIDSRELMTTSGDTVRIPDPARLTYRQFRRFAGCPICNTHLQSIVARHHEIVAAGISEVVVFHSTPQEGDNDGRHHERELAVIGTRAFRLSVVAQIRPLLPKITRRIGFHTLRQ
jgi:hypothetical protein